MYHGVFTIFKRYWRAYGGLRALLRSFYLHVAGLLLVLTVNTWTNSGWWDQAIGVLPNLLGFTLGGFAIFIGFGDERFRQLLAEPDDGDDASDTIYVDLCATFVHFIVIQLIALICAVIAKAWWFSFSWPEPIQAALPTLNLIGGFVGYGMFLYALTSVLAATMHLFRIATMYEDYQRSLSDSSDQ